MELAELNPLPRQFETKGLKSNAMLIIEPRYRRLFGVLFTVFLLFGTSLTIIGATLPKILSEFGWDYLIAGTVLGAGSVAFFVSTFIAGYLVKCSGPKPTMLCGVTLEILGMAFFATTPDPLTNTLLSVLIGIGQGLVEIAVSWSTLHIDPQGSGRPMNMMHGAFAVGAILGPLAVSVMIQSGLDWTVIFRAMAFIFILLTVLLLLTPMPQIDGRRPEPGEKTEGISKHPAYWLSFFALFLYMGVDLGVSTWVAEYFVAVFAYSKSASALLVSLFWAGLLAGRFGVPLLYNGGRKDMVLVGLSTLAALSINMLALLGFTPPNSITDHIGPILVLLAGLGCSLYYPAVITLLGRCFPHAQSQALGFAATGGGIGAFVFPLFMSAIAERWGLRVGFATYGVFAIAMTVVAGRLVAFAKNNASPRD